MYLNSSAKTPPLAHSIMRKSFEVQIRFTDIDSMGHVNNAVYFQYFELARLYYLSEYLGSDWDWKSKGIILVKNEAEYFKPTLLADKPIVTLRVTDVGNKRFNIEHHFMVDGVLHAVGRSIIVCFDYTLGVSIPIPDKLRSFLAFYS